MKPARNVVIRTVAAGVCQAAVGLCVLMLTAVAVGSPQVRPGQAQQLRVAESIWGFDGRVVPGQFNPVSLLLDNLSDDPIEGWVSLKGISGMVRDSGGQLVEPIYLSPHTRRWVQFYPYINRYSSGWRVSVISLENRTLFTETMDQGRSVFESISGEGDSRTVSAVILDKSGLSTRQPTTVKHMPDSIFPPYATATVPLSVLFLDHVPDWETPRQAALMSWLKCGGRLHLLLDSNGQTLQFPAEMAALNEPFSDYVVGSGRVIRHDLQRAGLTAQIVNPLVAQLGQKVDPEDLEASRQEELQLRNSVADPAQLDSELFSLMRELTQPEHAWWLIFLLSFLYVGMIFPGCWFISQKKSLHYLATYGAIAGLSVVFSLVFLMIGRRGYGESTVMHSLMVARGEDELHWNALQWNTLFVTAADRYSISSQDEQALWASGSLEDNVDAQIRAGNQSEFDVRIPPFSSQTVLNRRRLTLPDWKLKLVDLTAAGTSLLSVQIQTGDAFPSGEEWEMMLLYGRDLYTAKYDPATKTVTHGRELQRLSDFCNFRRPSDRTGFWGMGFSRQQPQELQDSRTPAEKFYDESINGLVHRSLLDDGVMLPGAFQLPADRVRLMMYGPLPESAAPTVSAQMSSQGRVLFVRDLTLAGP